MIREIQNAQHILSDWLGKGGNPVSLEQAQQRADVCLHCPHNYRGRWLWSLAAQIAIRSQMKLRQTMRIHLNGEEDLRTCDICGCVLPLKVHVPFGHIQRYTTHGQFLKYPLFCWQRQEYENTKQKQ